MAEPLSHAEWRQGMDDMERDFGPELRARALEVGSAQALDELGRALGLVPDA